MPLRRLLVLIRHLPPESAVHRAINGWSIDTELAAVIVEQLDAVIRVTAMAAGAKPSQLGRPLRLPRPDRIRLDEPARPTSPVRQATPDEIAAALIGAGARPGVITGAP